MPALFTRMSSQLDLSASCRQWTGNDATNRHHHGLVNATEDPLDIVLQWKASASAPTQLVGYYRLYLNSLTAQGFLPLPRAGKIRLRFFHARNGCIYIQRNSPDAPGLLVGHV
jgi:hypothetical protein